MDGLKVKIDYSDASCSALRYDSSSGTVSCTNARATIVFKVRRWGSVLGRKAWLHHYASNLLAGNKAETSGVQGWRCRDSWLIAV